MWSFHFFQASRWTVAQASTILGVVATAVTSKSDPVESTVDDHGVDDQEKWINGAGKINQQKTTNIIVNQNDQLEFNFSDLSFLLQNHFYCYFTV